MSLSELNLAIIRLHSENYEPVTIALELRTTPEHVWKIIERDRSRAINNSDERAHICLELYRNGSSLEEIGQKYGVTRERVRQIIKKQLGYELGYGPLEQQIRKPEIDVIYRSIVEGSREERVEENVEGKLNEALDKGLEPQYFDSLLKFTTATGITAENLKKFKPEVYDQIVINQRRRVRRWSTYFDACKICGLTTNKHRSSGYCVKCYAKSPEWKEMVKMSYQRNKTARQKAFKKYAEDYYTRPEVIAKQEREYDLKYFGGNRKLALERDGYKCITCGMSIDVKFKSGKPKVRVWHLDDTDDNSLENLGTYDQSCFIKKYGANGKFRLKRKNRS